MPDGQALPYAHLLASTLTACVQLLHVVPTRATETLLLSGEPLLVGDPTAPLEVRERHLQQRLHYDATLYPSPHDQALREAGLEVAVTIEDGEPAACIVACALDLAPALIVMASHGYSGLTRWELGSVADRVVQTSETPVLIVRGGQKASAPPAMRRILVPLDGSPLAEQAMYPAILGRTAVVATTCPTTRSVIQLVVHPDAIAALNPPSAVISAPPVPARSRAPAARSPGTRRRSRPGSDLGQAVQQLKQEPGKGLFTGGVTLPLMLAELGLIDEYEFVIHPRLVGHGPTLFARLSKLVDLKLVNRIEFGSGAVALRYETRR